MQVVSLIDMVLVPTELRVWWELYTSKWQLQYSMMNYLIEIQGTIKTQKRDLLTQTSVVLEGFSEEMISLVRLEANGRVSQVSYSIWTAITKMP